MKRVPVPPNPLPALQRAQLRWQCLASVVASEVYARDKVVDAWLHDHAYRPSRAKNGPGQLARMVAVMTEHNVPDDVQDARILEFVRGVRRDVTTPSRTNPAA